MVIQIPNPLLLPQSYGMGEVAGMSFGSNYVILMQIGYRYYAPRIIEEMEAKKLDHPLNTVWWNKWQKFMKIYSEKSIKNTKERTLEIPEKALNAIWDKMTGAPKDSSDITDTSALQLGEIFEARYTPSRDREGDRQKTDQLLADAIKKLQDAYDYGSQLTNPKKSTSTKKPLVSAQQREREKNTRIINARKQEELLNVQRARQPVVLSKRKAGQSQRTELNRLQTSMQAIAVNSMALKAQDRGRVRPQNVSAIGKNNATLRTLQLKIEMLMKRYNF